MKRILFLAILALCSIFIVGCESTGSKKRLPSRETDGGDLPWAKPASWEGGLPGMGGVGNPTRY
jgi:lipoprotein